MSSNQVDIGSLSITDQEAQFQPVQRSTTETHLSPSMQIYPSKFTVGYVYSTEMMQHYSPWGHPEKPERISRIMQIIKEAHYHDKMKRLPIRPVQREEALLVHSEDHWDKVQAIQCKRLFQALKIYLAIAELFMLAMTTTDILESETYYEQLSLYVMQGTTRAAQLSCGGVIEACLAVARNELKKTLAIVRPPGHHAEPDEHMGFCFFNNVAVAAKVVQQLTPLKRIMILDWCAPTFISNEIVSD
jgi:histone deacetylase 6